MLDIVYNYFSPFSLFRDAARGSFAEQDAAFRYNCEIRGCLLTYISRWLRAGAAALVLTAFFDALSPTSAGFSVFAILAAADAVFASTAVCAVFILAYAYASLSYHAAQLRGAARHHPRR
ncbi:MAG TPA: hypothetical protein VGO53_02480 [Steroidobacteraceae bacterium]|jgi:hypothetical protein|nr:hypothetical protein [Steroidobacteraceae bacterium]